MRTFHIVAESQDLSRRTTVVQERWLDPDCEYARHVDPTSSHVPTSPSDTFPADRKTGSSTDDSIGSNELDRFVYKGQRVSDSYSCLRICLRGSMRG